MAVSGNGGAKLSAFARLYDKIILSHPRLVVPAYIAAIIFFGHHLKYFRLDASSDSIVLENDADLKYYEATRETFGSDDYILLAFTLEEGVLSEDTLRVLESLSRELQRLPTVESVNSIITVPLFLSPKVSLVEMGTKSKTLLMPECDRALAFQELTQSPLYRNNVISSDGNTTAVVITFKPDPEYNDLSKERYTLRRKQAFDSLTPEETARLKTVTRRYNEKHSDLSAQRRADVKEIRAILARYRSRGYDFVESGLPMIVADMVSYIEKDILVFGIAVLVFLTMVLAILFRELRWVLLPLMTCAATVIFMMGYLGLTGWETTVVSGNMSSLLLIVNMQNAIYLTMRCREIHARHPELDMKSIVFQAVREISVPCFYTSATMVAGFATLIVSGIRPVIDFGILMGTGVSVAYFVNFTFFPAAILLFPKGVPPPARLATLEKSPVAFLAAFTQRRRVIIAAISVTLLVVSVRGMTRLSVENRFIDFFRKTTPISRGLTVIDKRLGGTTSLEVVLDGKQKDYWLEPQNLSVLHKIHKYVEGLPNIGKVLSLDTLIEILTRVNDGRPPNKFILNLARASLSENVQQAILLPYVTKDFSQARIFVRIRESSPTLRRDEMLAQLQRYLRTDLHLSEDQARVTGLFVLFNNLLKSLFDSQIKTLYLVFAVIYAMLVALFRSPRLAVLAILPAALPVLFILGTMGWARISLDMMTIMIASVTMGIAVDNMIQYTFRYRQEFDVTKDYRTAMYRTHNSIGLAILYSNFTIITGFAILTLSNFIPTIYFGLFTSLAMAAGFFGSLTLLPMLISTLKPFTARSR